MKIPEISQGSEPSSPSGEREQGKERADGSRRYFNWCRVSLQVRPELDSGQRCFEKLLLFDTRYFD